MTINYYYETRVDTTTLLISHALVALSLLSIFNDKLITIKVHHTRFVFRGKNTLYIHVYEEDFMEKWKLKL